MAVPITFNINNWKDEIAEQCENSSELYLAAFNPQGALVYSNLAFQKLGKTGHEPNLINPSIQELQENYNDLSKVFEGYITIGTSSKHDLSLKGKIICKNNNFLIIGEVDTTELRDHNKVINQLYSEITNLQRNLIREKHKLEQSHQKLEETNNTKDMLLSIIGHDLRSPVGYIIEFSNLLMENYEQFTQEKQLQIVENINSLGVSSLHILDNLLFWTRSQSGRLSFTPETLQMPGYLNKIVGKLQSFAKLKNIKIHSTCDGKFEIEADNDMLQTIFRNLIVNAIKFTHKGGEILVSVKKQETNILFKIIDNGIGMSPDVSSTLFSEKKHTTTGTNNERGIGLGLQICKSFVEKHNGKIWVESKAGKGSTFNFTIALP
ncbi:MAG: HAMP domain-containing histidine kinase [Bacteroidales bacterium]|nr:HAMP domain-containing histidine kinase [Bacteroidales bacterium]